MTKEIWKPIPGFEASYEASNLGRIRSVARTTVAKDGKTYHFKSKILNGMQNEYIRIRLYKNRKPKDFNAHLLVLLTFVGPMPVNSEVRHLNDKKYDNKLSNLAYGTRVENWADRKRNGIYGLGKLTSEQAAYIRSSTKTHAELARQFGVSEGSIRPIRSGKTHKVIRNKGAR
jgi:hypothetical protein